MKGWLVVVVVVVVVVAATVVVTARVSGRRGTARSNVLPLFLEQRRGHSWNVQLVFRVLFFVSSF